MHASKVRVIVMPRAEGWGLRCNDLMEELCAMIGIKNATIQASGTTHGFAAPASCVASSIQSAAVCRAAHQVGCWLTLPHVGGPSVFIGSPFSLADSPFSPHGSPSSLMAVFSVLTGRPSC